MSAVVDIIIDIVVIVVAVISNKNQLSEQKLDLLKYIYIKLSNMGEK